MGKRLWDLAKSRFEIATILLGHLYIVARWLTEQTALSNATSGNERVRSNFANKGLGSEAEPQCAGRECVRTAKCVSSNILARQTDQDTLD